MKKRVFRMVFTSLASLVFLSCTQNAQNQPAPNTMTNEVMNTKELETATFGAGCFWCVEAVFQQLKGVESVTSGYAGGKTKNPTYEEVCSGTTGHAEVAQIVFDPKVISFDQMLKAFWSSHDPTTLNRQGNDVGTQYRSVIFYHNDAQKQLAEKYKTELDATHVWENPIITEISPLTEFYKAENYHQNYYNSNRYQPYCMFVITPKLEKFRKVFDKQLKDAE